MHRTFWCGASVLVGLAACAYVASCYVEKHPASFVSRCAVAAYKVGTDANPITAFGHGAVDFARRAVSPPAAHHPPSSYCTNVPAHPFPGMDPHCAEADGLNLIHTRPSIISSGVDTGVLPMPCGEVCPPSSISYPNTYAEAETSIVIEPAGYEESEELPKTMPPCGDDQKCVAPETMPYCEDDTDPETKAMYEYWKSLFDDTPASGSDDKKMERVPSEDKSQGKAEESEPPVDESEAIDNDYHRTHPDTSPSMIVCPYSGRCYPANPEPSYSEPIAPPARLSKKKDKNKEKTSKVKQTESRKVSIPDDECGSEDCPKHPEVDTMEFRKSDAHDGAFNPKPM